jgi:hypothetical protein
MQLEELLIRRNSYDFVSSGIAPKSVGGKIKFSGTGGTVEVVLQPHHVDAILKVVAESMVTHTKALTTELTTQIIESMTHNVLESES